MRGRLTGGRRRTGKRANGRVIVPPLEGIELLRLRLPLVRPWRTAHGVLTGRDVILVRAVLDGTVGWAECSAQPEPTYTSEYVDGALDVLDRHLVPRLLDEDVGSGDEVQRALVGVKGHPMAKATLELAVLDAELRAAGIPLARHLGARSVPSADPAPRVMAGVAVGVTGSIDELVNEVGQRVAEHYHRVKLKIQPGWDLEPVRAVREAFGPDLLLQVDANGSYPGLDAATDALRLLDDAGLLLVEQPLGDADLLGHAELARRLSTPVCLDESITSAAANRDGPGPGRLLGHQYQGGPRRRLPRSVACERSLPGSRRSRVVRGLARDGGRSGRQPGPRRAAELFDSRRPVRLGPVLGGRHHHRSHPGGSRRDHRRAAATGDRRRAQRRPTRPRHLAAVVPGGLRIKARRSVHASRWSSGLRSETHGAGGASTRRARFSRTLS